MANCVFSFENYIQSYLTSVNSNGSEVSGQSATRLKDPQVRKRWRTPIGTVSPVIDFDLSIAKNIDVLAFIQPVDAGGLDPDFKVQGFMSSTDQVQHMLSLVGPGGFEVYNTSWINSNVKQNVGAHAHVLSNTASARYWRLAINAASLAGSINYLDIGVAWCGAKYSPPRNMQYGYNWTFVDQSSKTNVQSSGLEFVKLGFKQRTVVFSFDTMNSADAETISTMMNYVGTSRPVLFIPDPADTSSDFAQPIFGRLTTTDSIALPSYGVYTKTFNLTQIL